MVLACAGCFAETPNVVDPSGDGTASDADATDTGAADQTSQTGLADTAAGSGSTSQTGGGTASTDDSSGGSSTGEPGLDGGTSGGSSGSTSSGTTSNAGESTSEDDGTNDDGEPLGCACGWDPTFTGGGGYVCTTAMAGEAPPKNDPPLMCPNGFGFGSSCVGVTVGLAGCCDANGDVLFCINNDGGVAGSIECNDATPPQSCNDEV